jgi:hypothetical protein
MDYHRYQNLASSFPMFKKVIIFCNLLCIFVIQIAIVLSSKRIFDYNDTILLILIACCGLLSLIITHYSLLFLLKKKLKYPKEKAEFEFFIAQNKLKSPYLGILIICSTFVFAASGFVVIRQIDKEIKENRIEICCGKVYKTIYRLKRSQFYVYYNFNYKSKDYKGVASQNSKKYNGLYHAKIGIPIFIGDEYKVSLHKDKPWHNELIYSSPSDNQIQRFRSFLIDQNQLFDIGSVLDSIYSKYGFYGLIAYYHRDKENIKEIDRQYSDFIIVLQNDSCYQNLVNQLIKERMNSLFEINNLP